MICTFSFLSEIILFPVDNTYVEIKVLACEVPIACGSCCLGLAGSVVPVYPPRITLSYNDKLCQTKPNIIMKVNGYH